MKILVRTVDLAFPILQQQIIINAIVQQDILENFVMVSRAM